MKLLFIVPFMWCDAVWHIIVTACYLLSLTVGSKFKHISVFMEKYVPWSTMSGSACVYLHVCICAWYRSSLNKCDEKMCVCLQETDKYLVWRDVHVVNMLGLFSSTCDRETLFSSCDHFLLLPLIRHIESLFNLSMGFSLKIDHFLNVYLKK